MKKKDIQDYIMITLATIWTGASIYFFLVPSQVSIGSISGFSLVLANLIPLPVSLLTMIMNVILLFFGFLLIGKEFGFKTVYTSILLPLVIGACEKLFPCFVSFTHDQVLDILAYIFFVNIGVAALFNLNASSGGIDIVAKIMNKYLKMEIGSAAGLAGMAIALSSALVFDKKTVVLSILSTYFNGILLDHFIFGSTLKKRVCILSLKYDVILDFILNELHSGATKYHAYGAYSDQVQIEINTIVDKNEYMKLIHFVNKVDPDAFVSVYNVNEIMYKPKI
ncbi:MAG: YitT family protein [Traorella sp.]